MIEVNNLNFSFDSLQILNSVSFNVERNKPISILGPSGCGKSTMLRCISGNLIPQSGNISINGENPEQARLKKHFGFAFQDHALLSWKNVRDNIALPNNVGRVMTFKDFNEANERIDFLLELTELKQFENYYPNQLSGGMKQRVSLARALFTSPKLLLLDEPFASLDLLTRTSLAINLRKMIDKVSVPTILVTHSIEEAIIFAKKIIVLTSLPASIKEIIDIDLNIVSTKSLESKDFINIVSHCRSLLLDEINS